MANYESEGQKVICCHRPIDCRLTTKHLHKCFASVLCFIIRITTTL